MISTIHVSVVAQYFELSPLFTIPFMVLYFLYGSPHYFYTFVILLCLHVVFVIILHFTQKVMKTFSLRLFERFIYNEPIESNLPKFVVGSITSSIRLIARYQSSPIVLSRFMENQKQTRLRTSSFIEICRFLAIFPDYRRYMLEEVKNFTTKSIYNDFMLYMFEYLLEKLNSTVLPEIYTKSFDYFYSNYIVHSYFYWNARKEKKIFRSFFEAFACSHYAKEAETMLNGLFYLCPFVPNLHKYLADVLLNIHGDFEGYKKEMRFCLSLEKKKLTIFDPYLQANAKINPRILQFCDQDSHILYNISSTPSAMNTINVSNTFSIFPKKHKTEKFQKKKTVASKIIRSERRIPLLHIFHFILPPLIAIAFIFVSESIQKEYRKNSILFGDSIESIEKSFYNGLTSIFIPFSLKKYAEFDLTDLVECQMAFASIPHFISEYYLNSPMLANRTDMGIILAFHEISSLIQNSKDVCEIVSNLSDSMNQISISSINLILRESNNCYDYIISDLELITKLHYINLFLLYGTIGLILFLILYFSLACFSLNNIMKDNQKALDFLSSKRRISPLLQDIEIRENLWDQLIGFDTSLVFSDSSFDSDLVPDNEIVTTSASLLSTTLFSAPAMSSAFNSQSTSAVRINKSFESSLVPSGMLDTADSTESHSLKPSSFAGNTEIDLIDNSKLIDPNKIKFSDENDHVNSSHFDSIMVNNNNINVNVAARRSSSLANLGHHSENIPSNDSNNNNDNDSNDDKIDQSLVNLTINAGTETTSPLPTPREFDLNELHFYLKGKTKNNCILGLFTVLIILFPWILLYLLTFVGYYPLVLLKDSEYKEGEKNLLYGKDFSASVRLLSEVLSLYRSKTINESTLHSINETFSMDDSPHRELYFREQCFEYNHGDIRCFTVSSVVQQIYDKNYTDDFLELFALPLFATFSEVMLNDISNTNDFQTHSNSPKRSFILLAFIYLFISIIVGYKKTVFLKKSLNSLFHFPSFENVQNSPQTTNKMVNSTDQNISSKESLSSNASINIEIKIDVNTSQNDESLKGTLSNLNEQKNDEEELNRFPTNIIIVTSVAETDEIYSISDTCIKIINRKPSDLICRKFSKIFPMKKIDNNFEIREHNGKMFISKSIIIGKISKTVLIEALKSESKNKATNIAQKLINFMPNYFAKQFSEEFVNFFNFYHCVLIFTRIDSNAGQIENFFNLINRLDQSFYNIDFIRSNGSVLTFVCTVKDELEIVLFLRDLILGCEESCKKKMENFALKSVYIDIMEELNLFIQKGDIEPEISFEDNLFFEIERLAYFVDDHFVAFSNKLIDMTNSLSKFSNQVKNINGKNIHSIPFKLFSDEILKNL